MSDAPPLPAGPPAGPPSGAPPAILELAAACVAYVKKALDVELDYTPETLPLLDHYLGIGEQALGGQQGKPEIQTLVASAAGAYFGEVVRRRHPSFWLEASGAEDHRLAFRERWLVLYPVRMMREAMVARTGDGDAPSNLESTGIELDAEDRAVVEPRLAELPQVSHEEYLAPSTRLEVIDIAVDALRARDAADAKPPLALGVADYAD